MKILNGSLAFLFIGFNAFAADVKPTAPPVPEVGCEDYFISDTGAHEFEIVASDRVPSEAAKFREYIAELTSPGGAIQALGIKMTGQIIEFVQGQNLNALKSGTAGGYPVSFYLDGAAVLQSMKPRSGLTLEVVYPGPNYQHGFYRDDNTEAQQKSIIDHVLGHNSFAFNSGMEAYRAGQGLLATKELDRVLTTLYQSYDKDEVQRYYLWSLTLARMLDWYSVHYQRSSEFEPKLDVRVYDPLGRSKPRIERHPKAPTENLLPAFAANMALHQPEWKRKILDLLHTSMAFRPALVHTQIMNEGWASILQEIVPRHTKDNHNFAYWFDAKNVMQQERRPNLKDPYSLGVAAWRRIRERFEQRTEIKALVTQLEKDHAFVQYAQDEIIAHMDDEQFLRFACDQTFVDRNKLSIVRKTTYGEEDPNMPPPNPPPQVPIMQWRIVSRDAGKVVQAIIDQVVKPKYIYNPRVKLIDFNRPGTGEVELVLNDEVSNELALEKSSLGPALYALAKIIDKPVSLEGMLEVTGWRPGPFDPFAHRLRPPLPGPGPAGWEEDRMPQPSQPALARVRVVVSPTGELRAYGIEKVRDPDGLKDRMNESFDEATTKELAAHLKGYIEDLYMDDLDAREDALNGSQSMRELMTQALTQSIEDSPYDTLLVHAPNAAGAILEYKTMVERRMMKALTLAAKDPHRIRMAGGQPRIRALPSVVRIQFDSDYADRVMRSKRGAPVDIHTHRTYANNEVLSSSAFGDFSGEDGRVHEIDGNPGDRFWGPRNPDGEGRGKGEEDGDDGDDDGDGGHKPGEDPMDPSWVDIPPDLYARFLGEKVKLPVLNKKPGKSRVTKFKPGKRISRMFGQQLPFETAQNAFRRGLAGVVQEGRDPDQEDLAEIFEGGFALMQPRDYQVKSKTITKKPEIKAVVTFVLDASGSTARYMEAFKRFVYDIEMLIAANYKGFAFEYIIFDTQARVMKSKRDFFRSKLGGGTLYYVGTERARKLFQDKYPRNAWDRYTFLMGDMEDFSPDKAFASIKDLLDETEFFGTVAGLHSAGFGPFLELLKRIQTEVGSNPAMGLTVLDQDGGYGINHIREVLRNEEEGDAAP